MSVDLVIRNAILPGHATPMAVAVAAGRIAAVAPRIDCDAVAVDAGGRLLTAGLVETHIHLDKAGIIGRCRICAGTLAEAVAETAKAKAAFTVEDVAARAGRVVEQAIVAGTTRLRTFVEIDPRAGFRSFEAIKAVRAAYRDLIDIEICAFAQDGLTDEPETAPMLEAALADGADLIGGCPYMDRDPDGHIRAIFDIAGRHDVAVDFHLDFDLDPARSDLPTVIDETVARGWGGRVSVGHVTKLSAVSPETLAATARRLADAGVAVTVLPATDLYLTGRDADRLVPRGVTPAHRLAGHGVTTSLASNNVLNPFTPFGDASLMRMANLYATVAHAGTPAALAVVFSMVTDGAARLMARSAHYGIEPGHVADLVLFDAPSPAEAVAAIAPALAGWKAGRPSFDRPLPRLLQEPADARSASGGKAGFPAEAGAPTTRSRQDLSHLSGE